MNRLRHFMLASALLATLTPAVMAQDANPPDTAPRHVSLRGTVTAFDLNASTLTVASPDGTFVFALAPDHNWHDLRRLQTGSQVLVEGELNPNGQLVAESVDRHPHRATSAHQDPEPRANGSYTHQSGQF